MDLTPLIQQMCAARLAQSDDPAAAQLLAQMTAGGGASPPNFRDIVQSLAGQNPAMQFLAQHLETLQTAPEESYVTIDASPDLQDDDAPSDAEASAAILELRSQVDGMFEELRILRLRNDDLALALGAAPPAGARTADARPAGAVASRDSRSRIRPRSCTMSFRPAKPGVSSEAWRATVPASRKPGAESAENAVPAVTGGVHVLRRIRCRSI
jgi:hypothetical protein